MRSTPSISPVSKLCAWLLTASCLAAATPALPPVVIPSSSARLVAGDLQDARKDIANQGAWTSRRVSAARLLLETGKKSDREKVLDVFFDPDESPKISDALLLLVKPVLFTEAGELEAEHLKRVFKLSASSREAWKLHGLHLAASLGVPGLEDEALELLKSAKKDLSRTLKRDEPNAELVRSSKAAIDVSCDLLSRQTPPSPDFLWVLKPLQGHSDRTIRYTAVRALVQMGAKTYAEALAAALSDSYSPIYDVAFEALLDARQPELVPALVGLLAEQPSPIDAKILPDLFRATGQRYLTRKQWDKWLERNENFWVLSEEEHELAVQALVDAMAQSRYGPQGSFFARPLSQHGLVFVLDVSGSMTARVKKRQGPKQGVDIFIPNDLPQKSRMELVKQQVLNAIAGLDEQPFNILTFSTDVKIWREGGSASFESREQALESAREFVSALSPRGGTALHAALEEAFDEQDIREIILLSDGAPSTGITDHKRILRDVKRWAQKRKNVALHCISMGTPNSLLKKIGPATPGGSYTEVEVASAR